MNVLIVGGTGLIGGEIALHLKQQGHSVTLMARKPAQAPALAELPLIKADYINDQISSELLAQFDHLVFSATADIRNLPMDGSVTPEDFYTQANDIAVPKFFALAKQAGIKKAVLIGTFYPQVAPDKIGSCPYVTSRHNTCENVLALADDSFAVYALNAPFVLGHIDGLAVPHISALVEYAKGNIEGLPAFAPIGGTNHISSKSLAEATANCFVQGKSGTAYLVGDENLSWQQYLQLWFDAVGSEQELPVLEDEHPMFPHIIQFAGAGSTVSYEPSEATMQDLDYSRQQIKALVELVVAKHSS